MSDLAVIMSVYKNDKLKYVVESVQSILNQTFTQFHYYIVLDGPVGPEIDSYLASIKDTRIRLFRLKENEGLASALNYLLEIVLKISEYKLIARMDADDISMLSRFEKQRNFLLENPEISVLGCWYEEIDESGKHLSYRILPADHETLRKRYTIRSPFAHPSVMYRRNLIEIAGFYPVDTVLMEDNVLWGMAFMYGLKLANLPEYLLKFRIDKNFYKRRSGIRYGWNFIKTRFKINKLLSFPIYSYLISFIIGVIKMLPAFLIRILYLYK
jgi:glycosyltransferase involved in cell wall biosynthesis